MKIKTIVISLPHEYERRIHIKKEMEKCDISDYTIINGVNGNDIQEITIIPPYISKIVYNNQTRTYDSRLRLNGNGLKKGEMGASWSHLNIYEMLLEDNQCDSYLVFEDDAELLVSVEELKKHLYELKNISFDICHICESEWYNFNKIYKISDNYWIPERRYFNRLTAYIVTKTGAQKLLNFAYPCIGLPCDDLLSNLYIYSNDFTVIVPSTFLFKDKGFESSTQKINNKTKTQYFISIKDFGIWARLGNQMFQYAYLRALSIEKGYKIKLPINKSGHGYKRPHFFDAFDINILVDDISLDTIHNINETTMLYDQKLSIEDFSINKNILFDGYFQSEKYFKKYQDIIRSDFTFKENIRKIGDSYILKLKNIVEKSQIIALHIRRTDNLDTGTPTVLVSDTFRDNAINYIKDKCNDYHFLIFSDDKVWCNNNLDYITNKTIIEGFTDIEELYIMSLCNHFIIGSSTYSWWAAWLCNNKNKIIIVPDKWFNNKIIYGRPVCDQEYDLIPENWIRLPM